MSYETERVQKRLNQLVDNWINDGVLPDDLSTKWRVNLDITQLVRELNYDGLLKAHDDDHR